MHQHLGPRIPKLRRNTTDTGIVKSSSWYSLNMKNRGSINTRWFGAIISHSEKSNRYLWTSKRRTWPNFGQRANRASTQNTPTSFGRPSERRIARQQLEPTAIFQALGGVPLSHNTSAKKYFRNIRSCGAKTQMIWTRQKKDNGSIVIDQWNRSIENDKNVLNL